MTADTGETRAQAAKPVPPALAAEAVRTNVTQEARMPMADEALDLQPIRADEMVPDFGVGLEARQTHRRAKRPGHEAPGLHPRRPQGRDPRQRERLQNAFLQPAGRRPDPQPFGIRREIPVRAFRNEAISRRRAEIDRQFIAGDAVATGDTPPPRRQKLPVPGPRRHRQEHVAPITRHGVVAASPPPRASSKPTAPPSPRLRSCRRPDIRRPTGSPRPPPFRSAGKFARSPPRSVR